MSRIHKLEAKNAQAPQKSTVPSRQSLFDLSELDRSKSDFPRDLPVDLTVAPREGSADSLHRFRTRTASELPAVNMERSRTGKKPWRAALIQPVKSHLVLNPSALAPVTKARFGAMTGKELRLYI